MFGRHGETVVILRGTPVDDPYTNEPGTALSWASPERIEVPGCGVEVRLNVDRDGGNYSDPVFLGLRIFMPAGTDITARDRVEVRGEVYEVDGIPFEWRNPFTGWTPGVEVLVKRLEG